MWRQIAGGPLLLFLADRLRRKCLFHKFSNLLTWIFHGVIHKGKNVLGTVCKENQRTINFVRLQSLAQFGKSQARDP